MARALGFSLVVMAIIIAVAALLWPAGVALSSAAETGGPTIEALSPRRVVLLARGVGIALAAATIAQFLGIALAVGLCHRAGWVRGITMWACLTAWLAPAYVSAYAWSLPVLPAGIPTGAALANFRVGLFATYGRAIICLSCWVAPAAALVLAGGWRIAGRAARDHALQDAGSTRAAFVAGLPAMRPWIALSLSLTTLMGLTEFSICHLCLVQTLNTEILAALQEIAEPGKALRLAWPLVAVVAIPATLLALWRRHWMEAIADRESFTDECPPSGPSSHGVTPPLGRTRFSRRGSVAGVALPLVAIAALFMPIALLLAHWNDPRSLLHAFAAFPRAWPDGLRVGAISAAASMILAAGVFILRAVSLAARPGSIARRAMVGAWLTIVILSAVGAASPPGIIGDAVLAAYSKFRVVSDTELALAAAGVARFSFFAVVIVLARSLRTEAGLAAVDGADPLTAAAWTQLPRLLPDLLPASVIVGLLSMFDVGAAQLVSPPGVQSVAITLLNQIHFGRNDDVIALSLTACIAAGLMVAAIMAVGRRLGRYHPLRR